MKYLVVMMGLVSVGCIAEERSIEDDASLPVHVRAMAVPWFQAGDGDADADADGDLDVDLSIPEVSPDGDADGDEDGTDADEPESCPSGRVHAITGECVACSESWHCTERPVCDVARGVCVDFSASQCAPCRLDVAGSCGDGLECIDRSSSGWFETVCASTCESGCPRGTMCSDGHCWPTGTSCTGWYANARGRLCDGDGDCIPLDVEPGSEGCEGLCYVACGSDDDCPPGRACDGESCSW